jgi:TolB-like protein/class 3 adenylate cyclase/Tfp pilus assembly protein PilF
VSSSGEQRRLAAIMFTDMVGYSALSQRDDKLALELLEEHRELLRKLFPEFNGIEIKTIGDAFLVEFNSALEAAQCAIEIQRALAKRNADAPAGRQIELKIGIHIGDVVHRGGDVYGDGVNIASRIEPLAGAGGICVSMDVERQIRNALETRLEKLAPTELKNISVPMELFRIVLPWERKSEVRGQKSEIRKQDLVPASRRFALIGWLVLLLIIGIGWWWTTQPHKNSTLRQDASAARTEVATVAPEKSIAVLPFENLSEEQANAFFASGIQDEILTRLAKISDLKVISRTSTAQYQSKPQSLTSIAQQLGVANILEGSVQKAGDAVHINVQLIKAATDTHLWAESYDRQLKNIFGVEGEVAGAIADALKATLTGSEKKAIADKPTENLAAYDVYLRGLSIEQSHWSYPAWQEAIATFAEAVRLDPKFALAWAHMATARSLLYFNGVDLAGNSAAKVKEAADQAITLQPDLGEAWVAQGDYRYRVLRDFSGALQAYDEARKRLPNSSLVFLSTANLERRLGRWSEAEAHYRKAAGLDPRNLQIFEAMGACFDLLRRYDDAQATFDLALAIAPNEEDVRARKAGIFRDAGRLEDAAEELARIPADSSNAVVRSTRIVQATYERRFNDNISLIDRMLSEIKPGEPPDTEAIWAMIQLGYLQEWTGLPNESRTGFARALQAIKPTPNSIVPADGGGLPNLLAEAYAGLGEREKALLQAHRAVEQYKNDAVDAPGSETTLAQIQARFGDPDSAMAALPHLLTVPGGLTPADLRYDPRWDPLRKDPRFTSLLVEPETKK